MPRSRVSSFIGRFWKFALVAVLAFVVGTLMSGGDSGSSTASGGAGASNVKWYTCSMHPQIKLQDPKALCPICAMELIPVTDDSGSGGPREFSMSEGAKILADIRTTAVERRMVVKEVRLVGKVGYDETRMRAITAWVPGRLDRLYIDYTGVAVKKGDRLAYMYSPELLVAQEALLKADRAHQAMQRTEAGRKNLEMQQETVKALADRLRLWGLTDEQIAAIRTRGTASDHTTILSPISGIVIHKHAVEGDYVKVGQMIYEIADLSRIWVYLDAYESDLSWIKYAQEIEFEAEAYPGEVFRGRISFIDPFLNEKTRTVKVRVTVDNVDGRLKPGMFVRARIHAKLAEGGHIVEPSLAGKWISPVHPEVVKDEAGECTICGTPLVAADSLGYVGESARAPLVIPASAPLRTGKRAVVYVRVPDTERPTFEGREVSLGPRTQKHYIVASGLAEDELVVSHGAFKIDSALQILAKPSMMSPPEDGAKGVGFVTPVSFLSSLSGLYQSSIRAQRALAGDDVGSAQKALARAGNAADAVDMSRLAGKAHEEWMALRSRIIEHARAGAQAADIDGARVAFDELSKALLECVRAFGHATGVELYESHCPMAFKNRGASWLADEKAILNPYFGDRMLNCGSVEETFAPLGEGPSIDAAFRRGLTAFYDALIETQRGLAGDDLDAATRSAGAASRVLGAVDARPGVAWLADLWLELRQRGTNAADAVAKAEDVEQARAAFESLNSVAFALVRRFGHARPTPLNEAFCPMAFDNRGASWVQEGDTIANPYFGSKMLRCGEIRETFDPFVETTIPNTFRDDVSKIVTAYLDVGEALSRDDLKKAITAAAAIEDGLSSVRTAGLTVKALEHWRKITNTLREATSTLGKATDLEAARRPFVLISDSLADALARFGHGGPDDLVEIRCSMAFSNRGANWIQRGNKTRNPYFGASMYRCGDVARDLPREPKD